MLQKEIMILCIVICHIPMKFIPSGGKCHRCRQEENQDSIGKALKDIALMRFSMAAKYIIRYVGVFLLALFALVALVALPIIAVIAIIYNSPFAIFFPSISSGETTQDVLSAYVAEFNKQMRKEIPHPLPSRKSM